MLNFDPISVLSKSTLMESEVRKAGVDTIKRMLTDNGYFNLQLDDAGHQCLAEAMLQNAQIISKSTGGILIRKEGREAPASVGPDKIKIGDSVQLLNWKPMGVKGATIDLYPKGKVTKTYFRKCLVKSGDKEELEDRLEGIELDGKGPEDIVMKDGNKLPYILKDSTVIMRYPDMAQPSGETDHVSYGIV
jgi:hypothetical protein